MEATLRFTPLPFGTRPCKISGKCRQNNVQLCHPLCAKTCFSFKKAVVESRKSSFWLHKRPFPARKIRQFTINSSDQLRSDCLNSEPISAQEAVPLKASDGAALLSFHDTSNFNTLQYKPKMFQNRFLNFVRINSVLNNAAESFFKSEIRRRLFVTAVLIVISRIGYYIPLPGFDRRLIPQDYLSFISGSVDELGDFTAELKLSFFQLGISPQILASILMQVLCHVIPSLVKLRKEGLDGHEKIKSYMCV